MLIYDEKRSFQRLVVNSEKCHAVLARTIRGNLLYSIMAGLSFAFERNVRRTTLDFKVKT